MEPHGASGNDAAQVVSRKSATINEASSEKNEPDQVQRQLQESAQQLQAAIEIARLGVWKHDFATGLTDCSIICKEQHGCASDEMLDYKVMRERIVSSDRAHLEQCIQEALKQDKEYSVEYRIERPDGSICWLVNKGRAQYSQDGKAIGVVGVTLDITERKLAEQRKDTFTSITGHELKTPLTTLKGFTQMLKKQLDRLDLSDQVATLTRMEGQINVLTRLVNEMQDISSIQAGKLEYNHEAVLIDLLVRNVAEMLQQTSSQHAIQVSGETGCTLVGDNMRLEQVFANLITNAIKYSPYANLIEIRLTRLPGKVIVAVQDHGIGIPAEEHKRIFARFYQISSPQRRKIGGSGIGLYIVQEIIEHHQGKIWVASRQGEGATFYVELPLTPLSETIISDDSSGGGGPTKDT